MPIPTTTNAKATELGFNLTKSQAKISTQSTKGYQLPIYQAMIEYEFNSTDKVLNAGDHLVLAAINSEDIKILDMLIMSSGSFGAETSACIGKGSYKADELQYFDSIFPNIDTTAANYNGNFFFNTINTSEMQKTWEINFDAIGYSFAAKNEVIFLKNISDNPMMQGKIKILITYSK